jgi:acetoacetyl-CoA synthetase
VERTKATIVNALTPRHVPKLIFKVPESPYKINSKNIELAFKQIILVETLDAQPQSPTLNV